MTDKQLPMSERNQPLRETSENRPGDALKLARLKLQELSLKREIEKLDASIAESQADAAASDARLAEIEAEYQAGMERLGAIERGEI